MKMLILPVLAVAVASPCFAEVLPFTVFENHSGASVLGLNLVVEVAPAGTSTDLVFRNQSTIDSVVTSIHIEATGSAMAVLINPEVVSPQMPQVNFVLGAPSTPPGSISAFGGSWAGTLLTMRASSPAVHNGLSPGGSVALRMNASPEAVWAALGGGEFRIAQHVQSLGGGESVWAATTAIPAPGAGMVGGLALVLLAGRRRR